MYEPTLLMYCSGKVRSWPRDTDKVRLPSAQQHDLGLHFFCVISSPLTSSFLATSAAGTWCNEASSTGKTEILFYTQRSQYIVYAKTPSNMTIATHPYTRVSTCLFSPPPPLSLFSGCPSALDCLQGLQGWYDPHCP